VSSEEVRVIAAVEPPSGAIGSIPAAMESDEALVRRTLAGDLRGFELIVQRHRPTVRRVAARMVGAHEADDVAQDAFLRAFHRLRTYRAEAPFRTWLLRIAHNAALDALARRGDDDDPPPADPPPTTQRTPADELESSERQARLADKVGLLRAEHRAVLVLRDIEGLSYEEIAEVTATPLGSVKGRLSRARGELIELLRRNSYDWDLPG
jgi:RNA polymerase sigma-70 factor, ECF subfamily